MGFASVFHPYVNDVDIGDNVAIVGPGKDKVDIDYFLNRKTKLTIICPCDAHNPSGTALHIRDTLENIGGSPDHQGAFTAMWCTHVLEHSRNPGVFLDACLALLKPGGHLFVAVPPLKHEIVGGHMSLWNMGLLWYHLILAGFDVHNGRYASEMGYNLFAHVQRPEKPIVIPPLAYDNPDIETLHEAGLWPKGFHAQQGFNGNI